MCKHACIGCRVGTRRPADRLLVDVDDLIYILNAGHAFVLARSVLRLVHFSRNSLVQNLVDETALAGARNAGHADELSQREFHVDLLQVVLFGALNGQKLAAAPAPYRRDLDLLLAAQVLSGDRCFAGFDVIYRSLGYQSAAVHAGARPDVDDLVCRVHGFLIVFDNDEGVADIRQFPQRLQKLRIVLLMQTDARFVQNIGNAHETGSDLCRQADSLGFAAAQSCRRAAEGQIIQTYIGQKFQTTADLLDDFC